MKCYLCKKSFMMGESALVIFGHAAHLKCIKCLSCGENLKNNMTTLETGETFCRKCSNGCGKCGNTIGEKMYAYHKTLEKGGPNYNTMDFAKKSRVIPVCEGCVDV